MMRIRKVARLVPARQEETMPGKKMRSIKNPAAYEALKGKGMSKTKAAKIANARKGKAKKKGAK
jgi:hypothetical protein